jgi:hypothetical protein
MKTYKVTIIWKDGTETVKTVQLADPSAVLFYPGQTSAVMLIVEESAA